MKSTIMLLFLAVSLLSGQTKNQLPSSVIDGKVHPEAISDDLALRLILGAMKQTPVNTMRPGASTIPAGSSTNRTSLNKYEKGFAKRLELGDDDAMIFAKEADKFQQAAALVKTKGSQLAPGLDSLGKNSHAALKASMSPAGFTTLQKHLQIEKANMKIYPNIPMDHKH